MYMHNTPDSATIRTAIVERLSTFGGPWTPSTVVDLFIALATDLGLIPSTPSHIEMGKTVLDALYVFHLGYSKNVSDAIGLTARQREALFAAAHGRTYHEIGADLGVEYTTASTHLEKARKALGARNSTEAVVKAVKLGIIDIDKIDVEVPLTDLAA